MYKTSLAIICLVLLLSACGGLDCRSQASNYSDKMKPLLVEFSDAQQLASSTPRISLAQPIKDLQRIQREIGAVEPPTCVSDAASDLVNGSDLVVQGFLEFSGSSDDADQKTATSFIEAGTAKMIAGLEKLNAITAGQPTPTPKAFGQ